MSPNCIKTIEDLKSLFASFEVEVIYLKRLSEKQDNDKNQIYFGKSLSSLNIFPGKLDFRPASESTAKRKSKAGEPKIELSLDFAWITRSKELVTAPDAKVIDYFQYPEIRFFGFLNRCSEAPLALRRKLQHGYGKRILALGVTPQGRVIGFLLTEREDPLVSTFPDLPSLEAVPIFMVLVVSGQVGQTPLDLLKAELKKIVSGGWHKSVRLTSKSTTPVPFPHFQGGGYTLEALLGIASNASGEPDKFGYELKAYGTKGRISLMTPTADLGIRGKKTLIDFLKAYGHQSKNGDKRTRFTGVHRFRRRCSTSGLEMEITGYDVSSHTITGPVEIVLIDPKTNIVASGWSLAKLGDHWNKKHASAAYVSYARQNSSDRAHRFEYRYDDTIFVCEGTNIHRLLKAITEGIVYYDPADEMEAPGDAPSRKERPQWRISSTKNKLKQSLEALYDKATPVSLSP